MTEPNDLSLSDASSPPPIPEPDERCAAIPWEVRGRDRYGGFWRTIRMVLTHPSRLGELIDQPASPEQAKEFRRMVVLLFVLGSITTGMIAIVSLPNFKEPYERVLAAICFGVPLGLAFWWMLARFLIGSSRWFFCPPGLSPPQRETSLALSYYLTAPLALGAVSCLSLPLLGIDHPAVRIVLRSLCSVPPLTILVWYYVLVVIGMRHVARRKGWNLVLSAAGMTVVWLVILAGMFLVPLCIAMWLLMYSSLT
jgi:hypothetical protein